METKTSSRKGKAQVRKFPKKWSARVMQTSDALDLESHIFKSQNPDKIARSLKNSAEKSRRRKGSPFQSAMSMLNFYINRAGKNLSMQKKIHSEKQNKNFVRFSIEMLLKRNQSDWLFTASYFRKLLNFKRSTLWKARTDQRITRSNAGNLHTVKVVI